VKPAHFSVTVCVDCSNWKLTFQHSILTGRLLAVRRVCECVPVMHRHAVLRKRKLTERDGKCAFGVTLLIIS